MTRAPGRPGPHRLPRRTALVLASAAVVSAAVLVGALIATSYSGSSGSGATFVAQNGLRGLLLALLPLAGTISVAAALRLRSPARRGPGPFAVLVAALLVAEGVLGILTIGVFVLPTAVLVVVACATFEDARSVAGAQTGT